METMAQYSALMVMKAMNGEDKIRRFLKYELDRYLSARGGEAIEELPLNRVENQPYIHYRKGAVVMYLLQDRLGEDRVNAMLASLPSSESCTVNCRIGQTDAAVCCRTAADSLSAAYRAISAIKILTTDMTVCQRVRRTIG